MDPNDPEARIRDLERSLNDQANRSELGTSSIEAGTPQYGYVPPPSGSAYPPPPPPPPPPGSYGQGYNPPHGGYGSYPPSASFGGQFTPIKRKGFPTGWLLAIVALVFLIPLAGGLYTVFSVTDSIRSIPSYSPPSFPSYSPPSIPSFSPPNGNPGTPTAAVPTAAAGGQVSLGGANSTEQVVCDGGAVSIGGFNNTYEISGHCAALNVSGSQNKVTVDSADAITASGVDNRITYHSGSPQVNQSGFDNVVEQG